MQQPTLSRLGSAIGLDRSGVGYALQLALAAWLVFAIASFLHIENAYWVVMPIWVVAQSSRGLLHIPAGPYVALTPLGVWIAPASGLAHLLRGKHYYGALMAGMPAAIVVLPSIRTPDAALMEGSALLTFGTAVTRSTT